MTAQLTQNDETRAELLRYMQEELEREGIKVIIDNEHGILRISEGVLFDPGLADVKPQGLVDSSTKKAWNISRPMMFGKELWINICAAIMILQDGNRSLKS